MKTNQNNTTRSNAETAEPILSSDTNTQGKIPSQPATVDSQANRELPTPELLQKLHSQAPEIFDMAEVVGSWVWIRFAEKPSRQITAMLSGLGFHWNKTRQVWQHSCGCPSRKAAYDPHRRYRSFFPAETEARA